MCAYLPLIVAGCASAADDFSHVLNCVNSFDNYSDNWTLFHVLCQSFVERLVDVLGVVLFKELVCCLYHFHSHDFQSCILNLGCDFSDDSSLHCVRFESYKSSINVFCHNLINLLDRELHEKFLITAATGKSVLRVKIPVESLFTR